MAIQVPGKRNHRGRNLGKKRSAVAVLQLTAMVDMFTVLAVFLLQNFATTGQVLDIPEGVDLPDAAEVKELKPANVVVISRKHLMLNNTRISDFNIVKEQKDWMILPLREEIEKLIAREKASSESLGNRIQKAVKDVKTGEQNADDLIPEFLKITVQADKGIDFLSVKKVMYTVTESGIVEINFAVIKNENQEESP